jgi:hypothetical protein
MPLLTASPGAALSASVVLGSNPRNFQNHGKSTY